MNYFNRVTADGTLVFENSLPIFGQIIPSIGGDFLSIGSGSNGTEVQRYNREGKNVWSETSTIASTNSGDRNLHPYRINPDGKGGAYATWTREVGMFGHTICTQHVSADGDPTFGLDAMDALADENIDIDYPKQAVDTKNNTVLVTFPEKDGEGNFSFKIQKFNEEGDRLFGDNGKTLETKGEDYAGWAYNNYGVEPVGDGEWLICYSDRQAWALEYLYVARINKDGEFVWKQRIMEEGYITSVSFVKGDDCSYVVYQGEDDVDGTMLKGARIFDNGTFDNGAGISTINENLSKATSTTIHSIDGKLVQTVNGEKYDSANLAPGMYIITTKDAQGKTKSMKITK